MNEYSNEYLYDRQGRIIGRLQDDKVYDRKGSLQGRFNETTGVTHDRTGKVVGKGDLRPTLVKKP